MITKRRFDIMNCLWLGLGLAVATGTGCNEKALCPPHRRMMAGASCNGSDLQCAYDVPSYNCDGTITTLPSSCTCSKSIWVCPDIIEPYCSQVSADGGTDSTTADASAPGLYPTNSDAGTGTGITKTRKGAPLAGASCPLIFVRNGSTFFYETDVGGVTISLPASATANHAIAVPGASTFYHLLPHAQYDSTNGIEILLRESVREIAYFDEVKLVLVDHPSGTEVWSSGDESTNEWGYQNAFKIYTGKAPRLPLSAVDRAGRDVLSYLSEADNRPAPVVEGTFDNSYTLDFGNIAAPAQAKLIIDGWSIYRYRAEQDVQPYVEAEGPDGTWSLVTKFGAPYGDYKSVVVDLSTKLPALSHRLRVVLGTEAGARWVIDRIRLDDSPPAEVRTTSLETSFAELLHRGRATLNRCSLKSRQEALDDEAPDEEFQLGFGAFTRYGDVRELLNAQDDRYVIMRHGDQIGLKFPGGAAPQAGWVRSVVLKVDVIMKTFFFDRNVTPLPFHGMTSYPYRSSEQYPTDDTHREFIDQYNTRLYPAP